MLGAQRVGEATRERGRARSELLVFGRPEILESDIAEVVEALRSGWIGPGRRAAAFEQAFAASVGAPHAVAVASCTAALECSLLTLDLAPGDEVVVPALTFAASANAVVHAGGRPVFADAEPATMCLDPDDVARRITGRTRAIMPVHFAGRACAMDELGSIAGRHGLAIVEDCVHAIETTWHGQHAGTIGDLGAFSFHPTKTMATGGGGMVVTADSAAADRIRALATHGLGETAWTRFAAEQQVPGEVVEPGFELAMNDMQAALGMAQLARVETNLRRRAEIWAAYDVAFADLPAGRPAAEAPGTRHARHLYTLVLDLEQLSVDRDDVRVRLRDRNIGTGVHYRVLHLHDYYRRRFGHSPGDLPVSERISDRTVSLPLSAALTDQDVGDVIDAVRDVLSDVTR